MNFPALHETFIAASNPAQAVPMAAYMRNQFPFLGIKTPQRRELLKPFLAQARTEAKTQGIDRGFVEACWQAPEREFQYANFWVRRVAIGHQRPRKAATDTALLEKIITLNFGSQEFFINKAIGWALREYSKTDPAWVADFMARHGARMAPLSVREGSKRLG